MRNGPLPVEGLVRTAAEAEACTHPYPILVTALHFRLFCMACAQPVAPERSTLQAALADRMTHERTHP
jgi:hypothetical protein